MTSHDKGRAACGMGKSRLSNPFPKGSKQATEWDAGWLECQSETNAGWPRKKGDA
jgi:hypothetical protein